MNKAHCIDICCDGVCRVQNVSQSNSTRTHKYTFKCTHLRRQIFSQIPQTVKIWGSGVGRKNEAGLELRDNLWVK